MTAVDLLHAHLGRPEVAAASALGKGVRCWLCNGAAERGQKVTDWVGPAFTSQNRVRNPRSEYICEGCIYICGRLSPVPGRAPKEGKTVGGNWRNYCHWMVEGIDGAWTYGNASKGEKPQLLAALRARKHGRWWMAVADSGQKHVIPWATINGASQGGVVAFDDELVSVPQSIDLVDVMASLLTGGATKDELGSGDWGPRAMSLLKERLEAFELDHGDKRGSGWFRLALWLAQRDEAAVMARLEEEKRERASKRGRPAARGNSADGGHVVARGEEAAGAAAGEAGGPGGGGAPAVPEQRREAAQPLGRHRRAAAARAEDDRDAGGPGRAVVPRPADAHPGQLDLFGAL